MSDTPAKRQAYSFAFPPDKKQAFTKIADEKYQRPASWLLLAAIDQVIANGGLLGEELSPTTAEPAGIYFPCLDELKSEVNQLRERLDNAASKEYVALVDKGLNDRLNDLWADVESLKNAVKVSINNPSKSQPVGIKTASVTGEVQPEVLNLHSAG
jgi:hypothetical protein